VLLLTATRSDVLDCLASRGVAAIIGTASEFSEHVLVSLKPRRLSLIELASRDKMQPGNSQDVLKRLDGAIRSGVVTIHAASGGNGIESFPDSYFDFVHLEAADTYADCLGALRACAPKVKQAGLITGRGYRAIAGASRDGVVQAVNNFVIESGFNFLALTMEASPAYMIAKDADAPAVAEFVSAVASKNLVAAQIVNAEHKVFAQIEVSGEPQRYIFSFD